MMTKRIFAFFVAIAMILFTSSVFATNEIKQSMDKAGSSMKNVVNGAETVVRNGADAVGTGAKDLGNTFADGAARVTNNDGYSTARTQATTRSMTTNNGTILGMSANTWTWFILAIAALAIVGLVWYYAMQNKTEYSDRKD